MFINISPESHIIQKELFNDGFYITFFLLFDINQNWSLSMCTKINLLLPHSKCFLKSFNFQFIENLAKYVKHPFYRRQLSLSGVWNCNKSIISCLFYRTSPNCHTYLISLFIRSFTVQRGWVANPFPEALNIWPDISKLFS